MKSSSTMTRNLTLSGRLQEVLLDGHWIANTNYKEQIENISWQQATASIGSLNTIAALTYHINYYLSGLVSAFENGRLEISDQYSFQLPPIQSQKDWERLVKEFISNSKAFIGKVQQMDDSLFDKPFIDKKYGTYLRNIEGVIEHSYYHLGQILLIKKMLEKEEMLKWVQ